MKIDQELLEIRPTSYALYRYEMLRQTRISHLPKEEVDTLLQQARLGNQEARDQLIRSCLFFVFYRAWSYSDRLLHDDPMDLVSVGHLALLEGLDQALNKAGDPIKILLSYHVTNPVASAVRDKTRAVRGHTLVA